MKKWLIWIGLVLVFVVLAACSSKAPEASPAPPETNDEQQPQPAPEAPKNPIYNNEPVTIKWYIGSSDSDWETYNAGPIKKKFPHVTLQRINQQTNNLESLVVSGEVPDLITVTANVFVSSVMPLDLHYDMSDLIKKYNFDTDRIAPELIRDIRSYGKNGEMYGLPLTTSLYGLLYNKDLFTKFNVPLPRNQMTWDETIELARRLSVTENGISYRGLELHSPLLMYSQLGLNPITADDKALVATPQWQTAINMYKRVYEIPGNASSVSGGIANYYQPFFDGQLAMLAISAIRMMTTAKDVPDLNWDVVTFPAFAEAPNQGPIVNYTLTGVTPGSKVKDETFEVLAHLLSAEVMSEFARIGYITPLSNPDIQRQLGQDVPSLKEKAISSMYTQPLTGMTYSLYHSNRVTTLLANAFNDVRQGKKDVNTALREAEEAIQREIESQKNR